MKNRTMLIICVGLILLSFALSIALAGSFPEQMASHWNEKGEADGYSGKTSGLFFLPILQVGVLLLMAGIPLLDPMKKNIAQFRGVYNGFIVVMAGYLTYLHLLTLLWNLGVSINMNALLAPAFAALLYAAGGMMGKAKQNYMIGIRTPWTLANNQVWEDTHRVGGVVFKACGVITLLGIVFPNYLMYLLLGSVLLPAAGLMAYSYIRFTQLAGQ